MKEQQKNHERKRNNKPIINENFPPIPALFQKKEDKKTDSSVDSSSYNDYDNQIDDRSFFPQSAYNDYRDHNISVDSEKIAFENSVSTLNQSNCLENNSISSCTSYLTQANITSKSEIEEQYEKENSSDNSIDLELKTSTDYKRAFIHSLIFERKY